MNDYLRDNPILFSIIVPVYRTEDFLPKCVDSILSQTYPYFELILVDDGSPDNCPQICDEYAQIDNRVRVIHMENGGAARARNAGIALAIGSYLMFVDSDDYWCDPFALHLIADAIGQLQCDILCTNFYKIYENSQRKEKYFASSPSYIGAAQVLQHERYVSSAWSKVIKSSLLSGGLTEFVEGVCSEDIDWSMRLLLKTESISYVDLAFYCYLQRPGSISQSMTDKKLLDLANNVYTCINLLKMQDANRKDAISPYVSYQYSILLLNIAGFNECNDIPEWLSNESYLLQSSSLPKVQIMSVVNKVLGFRGLMRLLSLYAKFRNKELL